jgi:hypothetical protein
MKEVMNGKFNDTLNKIEGVDAQVLNNSRLALGSLDNYPSYNPSLHNAGIDNVASGQSLLSKDIINSPNSAVFLNQATNPVINDGASVVLNKDLDQSYLGSLPATARLDKPVDINGVDSAVKTLAIEGVANRLDNYALGLAGKGWAESAELKSDYLGLGNATIKDSFGLGNSAINPVVQDGSMYSIKDSAPLINNQGLATIPSMNVNLGLATESPLLSGVSEALKINGGYSLAGTLTANPLTAPEAIDPKDSIIEGLKEEIHKIAEQFKEFKDKFFTKPKANDSKKYIACNDYDFRNRILFFKGKKIPIPENTNQEQLCKVFFESEENLYREWNWDEMFEEWGDEPLKEYKKRVYHAARDLNDRISKYTIITDLFETTTLLVRVNSKYLE